MDQNHLADSIKPFFEDWRSRMVAESEEARQIPHFDKLSAEARLKWLLAFAATIEVGARMGEAIAETLGALPDGD